MAFRPDHEIHKRRFGRNLGLGLTLAVFVAIVFGLTISKVTNDPLRTDGPGAAVPTAAAPTASAPAMAPAAAQGSQP